MYNNPQKGDISNEILRIVKKFIASSSNNIFTFKYTIYSANNAESNGI